MKNPLDPRIAYGAGCVWWGSIYETAQNPSGLPCCPHCGGLLYEMESEAKWWAAIDHYMAETRDPTYRSLWEWSRGKCFRTMTDLRTAYAARLATNGHAR